MKNNIFRYILTIFIYPVGGRFGAILHSIWRHALVIYLCTIGGGFSAIMAGPSGIFHGAVLGACLAAAFPAIDYLSSKGKCRSVWTAALVGMLFGLLAGLIISQFKIKTGHDELFPVINQPLLLIFLAMLYGLSIHLSLAINNRWRWLAYLVAMLFCHYCRFLSVFSSEPYSLYQLYKVFRITLFLFLPFTVLWYLPVLCLLPRAKQKSAIINNSINQQGEKVL